MTVRPKQAKWVWLLVGLIIIRIVSIVVLLHTDLGSDDSILGGDAKRYHEITSGQGTPYRDFDVEYPPATLGFLKLIVAPTLSGTHLRLAISQLALELATAATLAWGFTKRTAVVYLILGAPTVLFPVPYMRTDMLAVFLATLGVAAVHRGRDVPGGASLAVATFAKIWPLVIAPILVVERRIRGLWAWALTGTSGLIAWIAWAGRTGIDQTATFRGAKGWQIESLPGAVIHLLNPSDSHLEQGAWRTGVAVVGPLRTGLAMVGLLFIIVIWWSTNRNRSTGGSEHLSFGIAPLACITTLLVFSTIISPQYVLWLVPFAAVAVAAGERTIGWLTLAIIALTTFVLAAIHAQIEGRIYAMVPLLIRNGLLIALLIMTIRRVVDRHGPVTTSPCV